MSEKPKTSAKQLMFSPLKRFRKEHCERCGDGCNPSEQRFIACVMCDNTDAMKRLTEFYKLRGAHY